MTFRALFQIVLADMATLVADGVRDVECKVVTSFLCCNSEKLGILCL